MFSIASDGTGLLTPVTNTSIKVNNVGISYFPTGPAPTRMKYVNGTLLIVNGDGTITSYSAGSGGQLTATANSTQVLDASASSNITSITSGGSYVYLTDGAKNLIYQYTLSSWRSAAGSRQPVHQPGVERDAGLDRNLHRLQQQYLPLRSEQRQHVHASRLRAASRCTRSRPTGG